MKTKIFVLFFLLIAANIFGQTGNVGIGTNSPSAKLEVKKAGLSNIKIKTNSVNDTSQLIFSNTDGVFFTDFFLSSEAETGLRLRTSSDLPANINDLIFNIVPDGKIGIGTLKPNSNLTIKSNNNWDLINTYGDFSIGDSLNTTSKYWLKFGVATGGGGAGEANIRATGGINQLRLAAGNDPLGVYIRGTGKVGIGMTSPNSKLEVRDGGIGISTSAKRYELNYDNTGYFYIDEFGNNRHLVIENGGFIGIGTTNPERKFHVVDTNIIVAKLETNKSINTLQFKNSGGNVMEIGSFIGNNIFNNLTTGNTDFRIQGSTKMTIRGTNGFVGIGTNQPTSPLNVVASQDIIAKFRNSSVISRVFVGNGADSVAIGIDGGNGFVGSYNNKDFNLYSNNSLRMTVKKDGNIGIGTTTPTQAKLVVNGSVSQVLSSYGYLANLSLPTGYNNSNSTSYNYSIHATDRIAASEFNAFSDSRIKKNKYLSSNPSDLLTLSKINVTNYQLIDSISKGNNQVKGFIAQQVEEIYPQAVSKIKDFVPDIYCLSSKINSYKDENRYEVYVDKALSLTKGNKVKLITEEKQIEVVIVDAATNSFVFESKENIGDKLFVFGKEVSDFRAIDYNQIFALGISAIQELIKENESMKNKLQTLESNMSLMGNDFESLKAQVEEMNRLLKVNKESIGQADKK